MSNGDVTCPIPNLRGLFYGINGRMYVKKKKKNVNWNLKYKGLASISQVRQGILQNENSQYIRVDMRKHARYLK